MGELRARGGRGVSYVPAFVWGALAQYWVRGSSKEAGGSEVGSAKVEASKAKERKMKKKEKEKEKLAGNIDCLFIGSEETGYVGCIIGVLMSCVARPPRHG